MGMKELIEELNRRRAEARRMGGAERVERQHSRGKLTALERVERLLDPGSFTEIGMLARISDPTSPKASGMVAGYGNIEGRMVCVVSEDFTILGGSGGESGGIKQGRVMDIAREKLCPYIILHDGAGGRVHTEMSSRVIGMGGARSGGMREMARLGGLVPRLSAIMGPCFGASAFTAGLADFRLMVRGRSLGLSGPPVVEVALGEKVTAEDLGGWQVHSQITGSVDLVSETDEECLQAIRGLLGYLPSNSNEDPPTADTGDDPERCDEDLVSVVPDNPNRAYDMHRIIRRLADQGKYLELKPDYGKAVITCLASMGGRSVGIVASNPLYQAGALDASACDKEASFIRVCDWFNVPLLFLHDVPGVMVGTKAEREGIVKYSTRLLQVIGEVTVPSISVVLRKTYGLATVVMMAGAMRPNLLLCWPSAEISLMGPEAGVNVIYRKELATMDDPERFKLETVARWRQQIGPWEAAELGYIDDIIDPRETRPRIIKALQALAPQGTVHRRDRFHWGLGAR